MKLLTFLNLSNKKTPLSTAQHPCIFRFHEMMCLRLIINASAVWKIAPNDLCMCCFCMHENLGEDQAEMGEKEKERE